MKYQNCLIILTIMAIVGSVLSYSFSSSDDFASDEGDAPANMNIYTSEVCAWTRPVGSEEWIPVADSDNGCMGHNMVTYQGLNWTIRKISGVAGASGTATVLALGNSSTKSADEEADTFLNTTTENRAISGCGLDPVTATGANLTDLSTATSSNYSVSWVWVSSCNNIIVNQTALYNQTTNNTQLTMFAGKNFSSGVTLQSGDQLNVTWYIWANST
jgi:hypothetical protein